MHPVFLLIKKELLLEWRQKYTLGGVLLYVISTVFVCFLAFNRIIAPSTWNALFWIIFLFASVNTIAKSFIQEKKGVLIYYYTLCSPRTIIIAKIIYNGLLMFLTSMLTLSLYLLFIGDLIVDYPMFLIALFLGSTGFSSTLTLMSAIASKANSNVSLMAILSFPIVMPLLMVLIKLSGFAIDGIAWSVANKYMVSLVFLNLIVLILSYLLFPYLWRD